MSYKVIISGASGMVGEGVARRCIDSEQVTRILLIGRRPSGIQHSKISELLVSDFSVLHEHLDELRGYDAMFFCAGVSSIGKSEAEYTAITYDTTLTVARLLAEIHPDMSFSYISGAGTDSTENGRSMWARVKGKTENDLMALPFRQVLAIRPGYIHPLPGSIHVLKYYFLVSWMYPIVRRIAPSLGCSMQELGDAMIHALSRAPERAVLEVKDLVRLAAQ